MFRVFIRYFVFENFVPSVYVLASLSVVSVFVRQIYVYRPPDRSPADLARKIITVRIKTDTKGNSHEIPQAASARVSNSLFLPGSGAGFQFFLDPDPWRKSVQKLLQKFC